MLNVVFDELTKRNILNISEKAVCLGCVLNIGNIDCDLFNSERKNIYIKLFENIMNDTINEVEAVFNTLKSDYNEIISTAKKGGKIRAWICDNPVSACGFALLCYILRDINCKLTVISSPNCDYANVAAAYLSHWGNVHPDNLNKYLSQENQVTDAEKNSNSDLWLKLKKENKPIRILADGKIISVNEDFHDSLIEKNIPYGEFTIDDLIGSVLFETPYYLEYGWCYMRIQKMIDDNKLKIIYNNTENKYKTVLIRK